MVVRLRVEKQVQTFIEHLHAKHYIGCLPNLTDIVPNGQLIICSDVSRDFICKQKLEG